MSNIYSYILFHKLNYLDKLLLHNFHLKLNFTALKIKIPIPLNYIVKTE